MVRVTVSGHPGSGTSTLVAGLCEFRNWSSVNGGQIFREEAARQGISLEDFSRMCKEDERVDRELDSMLKNRMTMTEGPEVVESRLAGWWAHHLELDCLRVWLEVSETERATRVVNREGGTPEEQRAKGSQRMMSDAARYRQLYDIDLDCKDPYNCIIEADTLSASDVLATTLTHLEAIE